MMSESSRMFVAGGVLIGALMLAALGLRFGNRESSAKEADGRIDATLASAAQPVTSGASLDDPQNAGIARVLQAVHDSLQNGDLASARVLLEAVQTMRGDEPQALLLQKELAAREATARAHQASAFERRSAMKPATHAHAWRKTQRVHHAPDPSADDDASTTDPAPPVEIRPDSAQNNPADNVRHAQPGAATQTAATATEEVPAQPAAPAIASIKPNDEPPIAATRDTTKTRAEVRDDLSRARIDGSLSRFGNPDPYGPGGVPSRDTQPAAQAR